MLFFYSEKKSILEKKKNNKEIENCLLLVNTVINTVIKNTVIQHRVLTFYIISCHTQKRLCEIHIHTFFLQDFHDDVLCKTWIFFFSLYSREILYS